MLVYEKRGKPEYPEKKQTNQQAQVQATFDAQSGNRTRDIMGGECFHHFVIPPRHNWITFEYLMPLIAFKLQIELGGRKGSVSCCVGAAVPLSPFVIRSQHRVATDWYREILLKLSATSKTKPWGAFLCITLLHHVQRYWLLYFCFPMSRVFRLVSRGVPRSLRLVFAIKVVSSA